MARPHGARRGGPDTPTRQGADVPTNAYQKPAASDLVADALLTQLAAALHALGLRVYRVL